MATHELIAQLIQLLDRETALHGTLLRILRDEQTVLANADMAKLEATVREQEYLVEEIRRLEGVRLGLMAELSRCLGVPQDDLTLKRLIGMAEGAQQSALAHVRDRLRAVLGDLGKINDLNRHLVENGLHFVEQNIEVLFGVGEADQLFYRPSRHEKRTSDVRRMVDRKV